MPGKKYNHKPGIYYRGKDKFGRDKWLIRYELPRTDGTRQQKSEIFVGSDKDAEKRRRDILYEIDHGIFTESLEKALSLAEYMKDWLDKYEADHPVPNTHETARSLITNHVINELGNLRLNKLMPYHIDKLYTKLRKEKKLATRTVRYVHSLLNQALERAVGLNMIAYNPASRVKPPKLHQREVMPFSDEQIALFLQALRGNRLENMFKVLLGTGIRLGEIINLRWDQVNFKEKTITVINFNEDDEDDEIENEADAKTENSKRTIPMFPAVERALKAHHAQQAKEKLKAGPLYEDHNLVFANKLGKPFNPSNVRTRYFKPLLTKAGLPNRAPHVLRHTFATTLIRKGIDMRIVSAWLGHKDPGFTFKKYHHYIPQRLNSEEAERINSLIFGAKI